MNNNFIKKKNKALVPKLLENNKVKIRLSPLPSKVLTYSTNFNPEENLNKSIATERPSSRLSDVSNFSTNSLINLNSNNDEETEDLIKHNLNKNVLEALKKKDLKRKHYFNDDNSSYSLDLNFASKRKREYDEEDDDEDELESLFEIKCDSNLMKSKNETVKPRASNHNRYISSKFKNNEILSSYSSIDSNNAKHNFQQLSLLKNRRPNKNNIDQLKPSHILPIIKVNDLNVDSTFNLNSNTSKQNSSNNLTNSSISPISKKSDQSNPNIDLKDISFKTDSLNNSLQSNKENHSLKESEHEKDSFTYNFPDRFHSIDEHLHDENKAKSRLGLFLKAIFNATSFITSKNKEISPEKPNLSTSSTLTNLTNIPTSSVNNTQLSNNTGNNDLFKKPISLTETTKSKQNSLIISTTDSKPANSLFNFNSDDLKSSTMSTTTTTSLTFTFNKNPISTSSLTSTFTSTFTSTSIQMPIMTTKNDTSFSSSNFNFNLGSSTTQAKSSTNLKLPTSSNTINFSALTNSDPKAFIFNSSNSNVSFKFGETNAQKSPSTFNFSSNLESPLNNLSSNNNSLFTIGKK